MKLPAALEAHYTYQDIIGRGGQAIVVKIAQNQTQTPYALKMYDLSGIGSNSRLDLFKRESDLLNSLKHDNIITIHNSFIDGQQGYVLMDFFPHGDVVSYVHRTSKEKPLPLSHSLSIINDISNAVSYIHANNVIHRDINPKNIFITDYNNFPQAILGDFGIVKELGTTTLTNTGIGMGTPFFLPPEVIHGIEETSHHNDIYSLGLCLYFMLTNTYPYRDKPEQSFYEDLQYKPIEHPSTINPHVTSLLDTICLRAIAKEKQERYQTIDEFSSELHSYFLSYIDDHKIIIPSTSSSSPENELSTNKHTYFSSLTFDEHENSSGAPFSTSSVSLQDLAFDDGKDWYKLSENPYNYEAQKELAIKYQGSLLQGINPERNFQLTRDYLQLASKGNDLHGIEAMFLLGKLHDTGHPELISPDHTQAQEWYIKAINATQQIEIPQEATEHKIETSIDQINRIKNYSALASYQLSIFYKENNDDETSDFYFNISISQGYTEALYQHGLHLASSKKVNQVIEGKQLLEQAALKNHTPSLIALGNIYKAGIPPETPNLQRALDLYEFAYQLHDAEGTYCSGQIYFELFQKLSTYSKHVTHKRIYKNSLDSFDLIFSQLKHNITPPLLTEQERLLLHSIFYTTPKTSHTYHDLYHNLLTELLSRAYTHYKQGVALDHVNSYLALAELHRFPQHKHVVPLTPDTTLPPHANLVSLQHLCKDNYHHDILVSLHRNYLQSISSPFIPTTSSSYIFEYLHSAPQNILNTFFDTHFYYKPLVTIDEALSFLEQVVERTNQPDHFFKLGELHLTTTFYNKNSSLTKALECFEKASSHNHASALHHLALLYTGNYPEIPQNFEKVQKYFKKAAQYGGKLEQINLALLHYRGKYGHPQHHITTLSLLEPLAQHDGSIAHFIGEIYHPKKEGTESHYSLSDAITFYRKAIDLGYNNSYYFLALVYEEAHQRLEHNKAQKLVTEALNKIYLAYLKTSGHRQLDAIYMYTKYHILNDILHPFYDMYTKNLIESEDPDTLYDKFLTTKKDNIKNYDNKLLNYLKTAAKQFHGGAHYELGKYYFNQILSPENIKNYFNKNLCITIPRYYNGRISLQDILDIIDNYREKDHLYDNQQVRKFISHSEPKGLHRSKIDIIDKEYFILSNLVRAMYHYKNAMYQHHPQASIALAKLYFTVFPENSLTIKKGIECLEFSASHNIPEASYQLAKIYLKAKYQQQHDIIKAEQLFFDALKCNYLPAYRYLKTIHECKLKEVTNKEAIKKLTTQTKKFYEQAIKQNITIAHLHLSEFLIKYNEIIPEDPNPHLEKAAEHGHYEAYGIAGDLYYRGIATIQPDINRAKRLYQIAIQNNFPQYHYQLGLIHEDENDLFTAAIYYTKAASLKNLDAAYRLGKFNYDRYLEKFSIPSLQEAHNWYLNAAQNGHTESMFTLGEMHSDPEINLFFSYETAFKWFREAALYGHVESMHKLAIYYRKGWGVKKNEKEANRWEERWRIFSNRQ